VLACNLPLTLCCIAPQCNYLHALCCVCNWPYSSWLSTWIIKNWTELLLLSSSLFREMLTLSAPRLYRGGDYDRWIGKFLERSGHGLIKELIRHFRIGTEGNHENLNEDSRCPDRDSKSAPPEYKFGALPLDQTIRYYSLSSVSTAY
jgi:hypothetical protein